jgi:hypothetical protein
MQLVSCEVRNKYLDTVQNKFMLERDESFQKFPGVSAVFSA